MIEVGKKRKKALIVLLFKLLLSLFWNSSFQKGFALDHTELLQIAMSAWPVVWGRPAVSGSHQSSVPKVRTFEIVPSVPSWGHVLCGSHLPLLHHYSKLLFPSISFLPWLRCPCLALRRLKCVVQAKSILFPAERASGRPAVPETGVGTVIHWTKAMQCASSPWQTPPFPGKAAKAWSPV